MKFWAYQLLVLIGLIAIGYWTRYSDWFPVVFGFILAVYGWTCAFLDFKRTQAKEEKEYQAWVTEMNDRSRGDKLEF